MHPSSWKKQHLQGSTQGSTRRVSHRSTHRALGPKRRHSLIFVTALFLVVALALAPPALAQRPECGIGPGLGSTLLFPYLEYDTAAANGRTTLISINNGSEAPTLARAVLWTDWGVPTLAFDLYLAPLDITTINFRDLFLGTIPSTGEGADLSAFTDCDASPPTHANPILTTDERQQLLADHQGLLGPLASPCAGSSTGDGIARGYLTVDVVRGCSGIEATNPAVTPANLALPYFVDGGDPSGLALIANRLWGDVIWVNPAESFAAGTEAVSIWADASVFSGTGIRTFYGNFSGRDGRDDRVPLPDSWRMRFLNGGPFAGGATLTVFHLPTNSPIRSTCAMKPPTFPLEGALLARNEDNGQNLDLLNTPLNLVTQRVAVSTLNIPYNFGAIDLTSLGSRQLWVIPTLSASGRFSVGNNATPLGLTCP